MEEMRVYIVNLDRYNEDAGDEQIGAWFTVPVDQGEMAERLGLNDEYEKYAIHDYELPYDVGEFTPIWDLNMTCEAIQDLAGSPVYDELKEIQKAWFNSIDELLDAVEFIVYYSDCDSMEDVARYCLEKMGQLGEVPEYLQNYIDYQALGQDMENKGNYLVTSSGVFEYRT